MTTYSVGHLLNAVTKAMTMVAPYLSVVGILEQRYQHVCGQRDSPSRAALQECNIDTSNQPQSHVHWEWVYITVLAW